MGKYYMKKYVKSIMLINYKMAIFIPAMTRDTHSVTGEHI